MGMPSIVGDISTTNSAEHADPMKNEKTHVDHENLKKQGENDQALVSNEMTLSTIGSDIFVGDSAATSHMTNNKTGVYDLKPIRGSVMIGNGESISCTHKGKLDVICKHKDGSTAKHTRKSPSHKSVFSIWVDLFLCRSIQLLVLSYAEMSVYMYLSQLMSTFTNYHKGVSSSRWCLHSMTRRTSDPTITHKYLYTCVPQI